MKKIIAMAFLLGTMWGKAQDASRAFSAAEIVWCGLDFSKATFVGQFDQGMGAAPANGTDMKNKYIPAWNSLIASEQKKYDFRKAFKKDNVIYDIGAVAEVNSKVDADKCMSFNETTLEKSTFDEMVQKYNTGKKEGVGLVFIVENFNKTTVMASVYVTFFDIASRKVLFSEKVQEKPVGIGIRNYWAGAIKNILNEVDKHLYDNWKSNSNLKAGFK